MYYTLAADDEESDAHLILGYRYLKGVGVPQSCETALRHYRLAAETGVCSRIRPSIRAMLSGLSHSALGRPCEDRAAALHWLEVGNVDQDPRYWLSSDGLDDDGDDEDGTLDANVQFYELAAAYGAPAGDLSVVSTFHGTDVDHWSHRFCGARCNLGDPDANLVMGDLHLNGQHGYDMDFDLARAYYERAAELGQPAAHGPSVGRLRRSQRAVRY